MRIMFLLVIFTIGSAWAADPLPSLEKSLYILDQLRDKVRQGSSPNAELERQAADLISRFESKSDRAKIEGQLAHVYGQADITKHATQVKKYATAALKHERDPIHRARLHSYLGSAEIVTLGTFPDRRRAAGKYWLQGYKETLDLKLPEKAPELPGVDRIRDVIGQGGVEEAQAREQHAAQVAERARAEYEGKMVFWRDLFVRQIVENYARSPVADAELRKMAKQILADDKKAEDLLTRVIRSER